MAFKKRYAQVGMGCRSWFFSNAMVTSCREYADFIAVCDNNPGRMKFSADRIDPKLKQYPAEQFDRMITENRIDVVIVTTGPDATHDDYICRAMELGCDVITEKPMATDENKYKRILKTAEKTGRNVCASFNYRYSPHRTQIKKMLAEGVIGDGIDGGKTPAHCWCTNRHITLILSTGGWPISPGRSAR